MKRCACCEYWMRKYQQCEHPDQRSCEAGEYDSPPDKYCELWESDGGAEGKQAKEAPHA